MTRYTSIEDANAALSELEERDSTVSTEKAGSEKQLDVETEKVHQPDTTIAKANGRASVNGIGENGDVHGESDSYSDSESVDQYGNNAGEELSEDKTDDGSEGDGDDEDEGEPIGFDDDDQNVLVRQKVVEIDPEEVEDFDREFRALMQESLESRKLELRSRPMFNMAIPMSVFEGPRDARAGEGESGEETVDEEGGIGGGNKVRVKVLVKKGSKQQTKHMYIPQDCSLVQSTRQKEAEELEEKQNIKRKILEYNERDEDEANGMSGQAANWLQAGSSGSKSGARDGASRTGSTRHRQQSGYYYGYRRR